MVKLLKHARLDFYTTSLVSARDAEFGLAQTDQGPNLAVLARPASPILKDFSGESSEFEGQALVICPLSHPNTVSLGKHLPWLKPQCLGLCTSMGMGDRLGIATPGHVRAIKEMHGPVAPVFAQQSIREMQRTGRSAQQVMDEATWGIFQEGWQAGIGSDADHLKTEQDIDQCVAAGFTQYTLDPGQFVDDRTDPDDLSGSLDMVEGLPGDLQPRATGLLGKTVDIADDKVTIDEPVLLMAVLKYGKAIAHVRKLYQHLEAVCNTTPFEVEISMDETERPTSPQEHIYIASELRRLGVKWVGFAPRFVGSFEKGVDYIGDLGVFEAQLAIHAAIAREFGPYKLSLHSGSDKFSIYPQFMHHTQGLAHVKTAGTSYLEALRTIAVLDAGLFKEIYRFAREHFEEDRASYHISAHLARAPEPTDVRDWPGLLDQFDARQIFHVTFGSVLTQKLTDGTWRFYDHLLSLLNSNRERYYENLVAHFRRHLSPFIRH
jgi:hypothetical protein